MEALRALLEVPTASAVRIRRALSVADRIARTVLLAAVIAIVGAGVADLVVVVVEVLGVVAVGSARSEKLKQRFLNS